MPKVPKISFPIFAVSQKSMGYEIDFLPADKHKTSLQIDSITLRVHPQRTQNNNFIISL